MLWSAGLEEDIRQGILDTQDPRSHCLCYHREFKGIADNISSTYTASYVETLADPDGSAKLDQDLYGRAQNLASQMMEHLGVGNCRNYYLNWTGCVLEEDPEYQATLEKLCEDFVRDMKEMVDLSYKQMARELTGKSAPAAAARRERSS